MVAENSIDELDIGIGILDRLLVEFVAIRLPGSRCRPPPGPRTLSSAHRLRSHFPRKSIRWGRWSPGAPGSSRITGPDSSGTVATPKIHASGWSESERGWAGRPDPPVLGVSRRVHPRKPLNRCARASSRGAPSLHASTPSGVQEETLVFEIKIRLRGRRRGSDRASAPLRRRSFPCARRSFRPGRGRCARR